ncbi:family 10 glycosylhydrolase [Parabacteroides sp. OttesenSCG-928-N08]|nr:family 10 glycosylhydrolase [Parabacteroides sp. OttesenSCG-928-N08]
MRITCDLRFYMAVCILLLTTACSSVREYALPAAGDHPKREFRGAWIQTVFQEEYARMTPTQMKQDFIAKLDYLQACGINAIIFQVRPEADAFYRSSLEPWSRFLTGEQGKAPEGGFDPMAFLIEACHARGMEFHAWLNPYRAATNENVLLADSHIYHREPERFVTYNKQLLFDPGIPANREFICLVVREIVMRYDVDAIHMDDYFYPYPAAGLAFPDDNSFRRYGAAQGFRHDQRNAWRRNNVNQLISELKRTILLVKPWVRFGISPFGIYRNKKNTPDGSGSNTNGLQNYDDLHADVLYWVEQGWVDYLMPQIYWEIGHSAADYTTLIHWWDRHVACPLYIGQDVSRTMKAGQLAMKMRLERMLPAVSGNCFWPANELLWNNGGVADSLKEHYHRYPALIPPYLHMHDRQPKEVKRLRATWTPDGYYLSWEANQSSMNPELPAYFVVYRFANKEKIDLSNPARIVAVTNQHRLLLPYERGDSRYRYVVTTVDRFHNESKKGKSKKVKL